MTPTSTNVRIHHHQAGPYHQHKTLYRRTPNLPCYCNNTSTKVFLICSSVSMYLFRTDNAMTKRKKKKQGRQNTARKLTIE